MQIDLRIETIAKSSYRRIRANIIVGRLRQKSSDLEFFELLVGSFRRVAGRELLEKNVDPNGFMGRPLAIVAHNTEAEPAFVNANATAQRRFG